MSNFDRILAATDLSASARHAAERAAMVSRETGSSMAILHVANIAPLERLRQLMEATPEQLQQRILEAAQQKLENLAAHIEKRYGIKANVHLTIGSLLKELGKASAASGDGLIVCGAKGESVLRHMLLGTTALRVLSTTTCPVLVVRQAPHEPYRRLLIPVDFSSSTLRAIQLAQRIAPNADLVLLHVFEVPFESHLRYASVDEDTIRHYRVVARQEAGQKLDALCKEAALPPQRTHALVVHGDPSLRIIEQEQEQDCDLIVMGKHGESTLEDLLLGSVTKYILTESQSDVLVSV